MNPIRVLLVDDHALFRGGIRALLEADPRFAVVGEAADGLEGLKRAEELRPDVVLLDLHMPGIGGREIVSSLVEQVPGAAILMLTVSEDAADLVDTLRAGASGYLLKNIDIGYLTDAICKVAERESVVAPRMMGKLVGGLRPAAASPAPPRVPLSEREREILALIASGASNKQIAREFGLAESTVKAHVQNILRKLELASRVQAAVYAVEHGIVGRAPAGNG